MKSKKKTWLIIGFIALALVAVATVVVVLVILNKEPEKNKYTVALTINNGEYGSVTGLNEDGVYVEGENITLTFTPHESMCIESIYVGDVNIRDYIADETIDIESAFEYTIENITADVQIVVTFDETRTIDDLEFTTRQESGVEAIQYGKLKVWGASDVYPKNGRVRLAIDTAGRYDFVSYILPDDRENKRSADEDYLFIDELDPSRTMKYDSATQSFIMSKAYVKLEATDGFLLELVFIPATIELQVYTSSDGETFKEAFISEEQVYDKYILDSNRIDGYTWYYCIKNTVIASNLIELEVEEELIGGTLLKFLTLDHTLYAENIDSKKIILVCVKNK